ncbi:MAG TPA: FAD-binding oxidoreductase [Steroidobacteraceae bacterium]|jgi:glycine/D-amino acid oxidase-like deaminating enzyme|nr:FAD-binding oxidoreductase [Steroidobacteraceae bacterium]
MRIDSDVVIAGGGVVGSACAYHLKCELEFPGSVLVIEPDPSYRHAASARSASSIRLQFSTPLNIALSDYGLTFLRDAPARFGRGGVPADLGLVESTYLYLATPRGRASLEARAAIQRSQSVPVTLHGQAGLAARYPWLNTTDLAGGCDTARGEGWFDGYALLAFLKSAAEQAGARYLADRVTGIARSADGRIDSVALERGKTLRCGYLVNAAGTRSREVAASAGVDLPVHPRKRNVFVFTCETALPQIPLVIDPGGLWFRSERDRFLCGPPSDPDPDVAPDDFDVDYGLFERSAWPALAHRVPAFEAIRMTSAWAGHYDYNGFDQNAFVGPVPGIPNFLLASGFSGHGLQHAPGIGRGLAEYLCFGAYRSLDLTPLSVARYAANAPLRELNVI